MALTEQQVLSSLRTTRDYWLTVISELASDAASATIKPSYSVGGQSVSWPEAYKTAQEMVERITKHINEQSWVGGPVESYWRP